MGQRDDGDRTVARTRGGERLIRVTANHFVAGCVALDGRIVEAAPILRRHVMGLDGRQFYDLCFRKLWKFEVIDAARP